MTTTRSAGQASQWFDRALLTDASRCPACAAVLAGPRCGACGLSLSGPAGTELWDVSNRAAGLLDRRDTLIRTMRSSALAHTPSTRPATRPEAVPPAPAPRALPIPTGQQPDAPPASPPRPAPHAPHARTQPATVSGPADAYLLPGVGVSPLGAHQPPAARASWPLQNVLLGLGALLLAGASIVFLAFAWGVMPLGLRAAVIAVVTAAVFGAATLAARKGLASSADAIAALGSLLVILDAWALHATGLVARPDGATFAALAALGSAVVLVALGVVLRLDVPRAVGCVLLPLAPLLLSLDARTVSLGTLLVVLAVAACGIQGARFCERRAASVLRVLAVVLMVLALLLTVVVLVAEGPLVSAGVLAVVAAVSYAWIWLPPAPQTVWAVAAGTSQTLAVLCIALAVADDVVSASSLWVVPLGALAGAASVALAARAVPRLAVGAPAAGWCIFFATTGIPSLTVALLVLDALGDGTVSSDARPALWAGLLGIGIALAGAAVHAALPRPALQTSPAPAPVPVPVPAPAPAAWPAPGYLTPPPRAFPTRRAELRPAPWFAALLLLGLALLLPAAAPVVAWWLVVPLVLVVAAGDRLPRSWSTALRTTCLAAVGLAILLSAGLASGTATSSVSTRDGGLLLAVSFGALMVVLLVARSWVGGATTAPQPDQSSRAGLLLSALFAGAAGSATALASITGELVAAWPAATLPLVLLALVLLAVADRSGGTGGTGNPTVLSRRITTPDVHAVLVATAVVNVLAIVATATTPGGWLVDTPAADAPPPWVTVLAVTSAVLLAVLAGAIALGTRRFVVPDALVASAAATPAVAVVAALTVRSLVDEVSIEWGIISLVVVAFFPVAAATRADAVRVRTAMETSSVVLGLLVLLLVAVRRPADVLTVALVIAATATAAWAFMPGRARAGWFALALAVGASWNALGSGGVGTVEAYTAPAALILAMVGARNVQRRREPGRHLLLAGSTILLLPTTLLAPASGPWRSLAVLGTLVLVAAAVLVADELRVARASRRAGTAGPAGPADTRTAGTGAKAPVHTGTHDLATWFLVLALVVAVVGVAGRSVVLAAAWAVRHGRGTAMSRDAARSLLDDAVGSPGLWILLAAVAVGGVSWLLARSWPWTPTAGPRSWAASLTALVLTVPAWTLVASGSLGDVGASWAVVSLLVAWGVVALLGTPPGLPRVGSRTEFLRRAVPPLVAAYVVALGLASSTLVLPDLLLTLVGVFVAVVAVRAAVVERLVRTWSTVSYGVVATLAPVTVALLGDPQGWRVALGVLAASGWLLAGLRLRWQAPVAIGGAALVLQVVVLAGPPALAALSGVPGWLVLAVTGLVLLTLGLTYERQITTARATLRRYAELR